MARAVGVVIALTAVAALVAVRAHDRHPLDLVNVHNIRWHTDAAFSAADRAAAADVKISATPHVVQNGDWVEVEFSGVAHPKASDFIAVYSPAGVDVHSISPSKWLELGHVEGYTHTGSGKHKFRVLNMRADVSFVLYTGSFDKPVYAAQSNAVTFSNPNEPLGLHLSLAKTTAHNQTLNIAWNSGTRGTRPRVQWGTTPHPDGGGWREADVNSTTTYTAKDMCGEPATSHGWLPQGVGFFHTAAMDELLPGATYHYRVGDDHNDTDGGWSGIRSFVAPPPVGHDLTVFAFGDLGQTQVDGSVNFHGSPFRNSRATTDQIAKQFAANPNRDGSGYAAVMHIGDISYARGYASEWPNWFDQVQDTAAQLPWMVCIGNHERDWPHSGSSYDGDDSGGECGVPYKHRFAMPPPTTAAGAGAGAAASDARAVPGRVIDDTPWYSVDFGSVHWLFMSTEHDYRAGSAQHEFIRRDLTSVDRKRTPWVVFLGHRPMYFAAHSADPELGARQVSAQGLKEELEALLFDNAVDLALWGHVHTYQRTCPVYKDACHPEEANGPTRAPVHLVIGHAGAGLVPVPDHPAAFWRFTDTHDYGFISLEVKADAMTVKALTSDKGDVMDSVTIPRNKHW